MVEASRFQRHKRYRNTILSHGELYAKYLHIQYWFDIECVDNLRKSHGWGVDLRFDNGTRRK